jgi:hypothetical protein
MVDFNKTASDFAEEINKSIRDPNHKVVSPVPVNMLNIGGDGKALMLTPEIEQVQAEILAGMNLPREFIFGGISYSGSSISLKILENQFITYRLLLKDFLQNFVIKNMARARKEWVSEKDDDSLISVKLMDLKMQDDVQQKQLVINLNGAGKVTNDYMWKTIGGIDPEKMRKGLEKEAQATVESEKEVQLKKVAADLEVQKAQITAQMELQIFQAKLQQQYAEMHPDVFGQQQQIVDANGMPMDPNQQQVSQQLPAEQPAEVQQSVATQQPPAEQSTITPQTQQQPQETEEDEQKLQGVALKLIKMPEEVRNKFLASLPQNTAKKVRGFMAQYDHNKRLEQKAQVDMRPMPEQKPPRRDSLK